MMKKGSSTSCLFSFSVPPSYLIFILFAYFARYIIIFL